MVNRKIKIVVACGAAIAVQYAADDDLQLPGQEEGKL